MNTRRTALSRRQGKTLPETLAAAAVTTVTLLGVGALQVTCVKMYTTIAGGRTATSTAYLAAEQMTLRAREAMEITEVTPTAITFTIPDKDSEGRNLLATDGTLEPGWQCRLYLGGPNAIPSATGHTMWEIMRPASQSEEPWDYSGSRVLGGQKAQDRFETVAFDYSDEGSRGLVQIELTARQKMNGRWHEQVVSTQLPVRNAS